MTIETSLARIREIASWVEAYGANNKPTDRPVSGDCIVFEFEGKFFVGYHLGGRVRVLYSTDKKPAICSDYSFRGYRTARGV